MYHVHRAHLITVYTAGQSDALARLCPHGGYHRHKPVLPRRHLHTLKIERVLLATLQIVHVKSADDLLPMDHIAGVDRSLRCSRSQAGRRSVRILGIRSAGTACKTSRRTNQSDGCRHEVATIDVLSSFVRHADLSFALYTRVTNPAVERRSACALSRLEWWAMASRANCEQSGRARKI